MKLIRHYEILCIIACSSLLTVEGMLLAPITEDGGWLLMFFWGGMWAYLGACMGFSFTDSERR